MTERHDGDRLEGRNGRIWKLYIGGNTQEAIAEKLGVDQSTVSRALSRVRASIPEEERASIIQRELDFLDELRRRALEISELSAPPVTAGKDGRVVIDPISKEIVRDYSGQLAAMREARAAHERLTKLLGLEAAQKLDVSVTERAEAEARQRAAEAIARLHGEE